MHGLDKSSFSPFPVADNHPIRFQTSSASPPTTRSSPQKATTSPRSATAFTAATGSDDVEMSNGEVR